ncbi:MAG: hypothetical protein U0Q19_10865 [Kineosporiaceae bacterium]
MVPDATAATATPTSAVASRSPSATRTDAREATTAPPAKAAQPRTFDSIGNPTTMADPASAAAATVSPARPSRVCGSSIQPAPSTAIT